MSYFTLFKTYLRVLVAQAKATGMNSCWGYFSPQRCILLGGMQRHKIFAQIFAQVHFWFMLVQRDPNFSGYQLIKSEKLTTFSSLTFFLYFKILVVVL